MESLATPGCRCGPTFVSRYVFPDGELVPIGTTLSVAEGGGFEVRDVESLREHYTLTLGHWVRRLEERAD
jgi:cyclopropane-fatty-acyl-phospholipid synthase